MKTRLPLLLPLLAAIGIAAWLAASTLHAGEPVGGASSIICDPQGNCEERQTVECRRNAWPWFLQCWTRGEGSAFASELRRRGLSPHRWKERWPQLARTFGPHWPDPNWNRLNRDFRAAAAYTQERLGASASWLVSCAASEGGTDPTRIAIGAAGEVGWMQYLGGTWAWMSNSAFQVRGHPPREFQHIRSMLGQVWTAGWAYTQGLSSHWHGRGCS